jgi:isoquinoline 1-oxidoreductase beta subunit
VAYLVEIDTTGAEPRLTRAFAAVDAGVPINRKGLEAQMQGALIDGWSAMFRASNHLDSGTIREGSYDDFLWARMNHAPLTCEVYVFSATRDTPGGAGELGFPPSAAACVNAYVRARPNEPPPRRFPIGEFA